MWLLYKYTYSLSNVGDLLLVLDYCSFLLCSYFLLVVTIKDININKQALSKIYYKIEQLRKYSSVRRRINYVNT